MPPLARHVSRFLVFAGLALLAGFTLWDNGPSHALVWPGYFYAQLLLLGPAAWLAVRATTGGGVARFGGSLDLAFAVFAGAQVAAALASPFRTVAVAALPAALLPVFVAYALRTWLDETPRDASREIRLHRFVALAAAVVCAASLAWWIVRDVAPALATVSPGRALQIRNLRPLGHWNFTSAVGLLALAWTLPLALRATGGARVGWSAAAALAVGALLSGASRGAFLGAAVTVAAAVTGDARRRGWGARRIVVLFAVIVVAVGAAGLAHPRTRALVADFRASGALNSGDRQRLAMLEGGGLIVRDHPWLGVGTAAVPRVYPAYRARLSGGVESALQLHNTPLQLAAESGLPAALAAGALTLVLGWRAWRRAAAEPAASAAFAALAGYGVFAFTDHQLDVPWFAASLGAVAALAAGPGATLARPRVFGWGLVAAAGVFALGVQGAWRARAAFADAIDALFVRDAAGYEAGVAAARAADPRETYYLNLHGLLLLEPGAYFVPVSLGTGEERFARGRAALEESLRINPAQETAHFNLGWALLPVEPPAAARHFAEAARLVPDKGNVYFGLGLAHFAAGRTDAAIGAWALELANDPAFVASPVWLGANLRPHAAAARAAAAANLERVAAAAPAGDPLAYGRRARFAAALFRWLDGDAAALARAEADAEPAQREVLRWLAGAAPDRAAAPARTLALADALAAGTPAEALARFQRCYRTFRPGPPEETVQEVAAFALAATDRRKLLLPDAFSPRLLFQQRRERSAYGLLMKNLDGPTARDLYVVQENRVVRDFLQPLFPEKGYLPGPVLAELLAPTPR